MQLALVRGEDVPAPPGFTKIARSLGGPADTSAPLFLCLRRRAANAASDDSDKSNNGDNDSPITDIRVAVRNRVLTAAVAAHKRDGGDAAAVAVPPEL